MGSAGKAIASIATGGLSDLVEGDMPLSGSVEGTAEALGLDKATTRWLKDINSQTLTGGFDQPYKAYQAATSGDGKVDIWKGIDRLVDPAGTIDYSLRQTGDVIYDVAPGVTPYLKTAGTTLGGIIGSYIPVIGTAAGAAIGSGIGSKLTSGTRQESYGKDFLDAGIAYGSVKAAGALNEALAPASAVAEGFSSAAPEITSHGGFIYDNAGNIIGEVDFSGAKELFDYPIIQSGAAVSSGLESQQNPDVPTGSTDTLESMIKNTVEGSGNTPSQVTTDPIPQSGNIQNTSTTIPDQSSNASSDLLEGAKTAGRGLKKAYDIYGMGKRAYNIIDSISNLGDTQSISAISAPQVSQSSIPVGSLDEDSLGELMRTKGNKHYGAVLA